MSYDISGVLFRLDTQHSLTPKAIQPQSPDHRIARFSGPWALGPLWRWGLLRQRAHGRRERRHSLHIAGRLRVAIELVGQRGECPLPLGPLQPLGGVELTHHEVGPALP